MGLDEHAYSSYVIEKVVTATARFGSFAAATEAVRMADLDISESQVRRLAHEVGAELVAARDRKVVERRRRQLAARTDVVPPAVVVEVDGGRIRTRQADTGPGVQGPANRESKIACFATLTSPTFATDPQPGVPDGFLCPRRVQRLVQQMKGQAGGALPQEIRDESADPAARPTAARSGPRWSPESLVRTCVASLGCSRSFGPMMAAEACERNFYPAPRRAFVADGSAYNWSIQQGYFSDFEPVVDLLHVLCYRYTAARAVSPDESSGGSQYVAWMRACWGGRVRDVLAELDVCQTRVGLPPPGEPARAEDRRDPRRVVAAAIRYLGNNQARMDDPRYRREGLLTTSSLVESLVGQFNARVKSKQKHGNDPDGAESILTLRAAALSEDHRLGRFFAARPGCSSRKRPPPHSELEPQSEQSAA
ncbi:MAG TPA: LysR family transcriptional regulator [Urbifossiella sp.]|nr:LysR family transcriptional regulator [Urbifossiella sp.]